MEQQYNSPETEQRTSIRWGGVLKGVAIVTAVAVVAVVGFWALQALTVAALAASPTLAGAVGATVETAVPLANQAGAFISQLAPLEWLSSFFAPIGNALGISAGAITAGQAATAATIAGTVGTGAAIAIATPAAVKHLQNVQYTKTTLVERAPMPPAPAAAPAPRAQSYATASAASEIAAKAPEQPQPTKRIETIHIHDRTKDTIATTDRRNRNWIERTGTGKGKTAASFAEQLQEKRSQLEQALSK